MSRDLSDVQSYYDDLAPRLVAAEGRNWHLQSRMALVLDTIHRHGGNPRQPDGQGLPDPAASSRRTPATDGPGASPSLSDSPHQGRMLDVGCGTGFLLEHLGRAGWSGVGIDLSPESVALAEERLERIGIAERVNAAVGSAYEPPTGPFDLVTVTDVLEHLDDPRACLSAIRSQIAPGGLLVISTPNRRSLPGARRWLSEHGVPGIRLHLAPIDRWQSWTDLESHAAAADFVRVSRRGIFFRPGGRIGSQLGRIYRWPAVRRAELAMSGEPLGRFGFYICLGFRPT